MNRRGTRGEGARPLSGWQIALRTGVAGLALAAAQTAHANPNGGKVVAGQATINGQGTGRLRMDQASDRVVINWDNFSIDAGEGVDFRQPNARSIALNRVTGPEISQILGELTANGQVYLINGNGIVFGKDAKVDVAGLVATSADIGNEAFMAGGALRFGTPGRAGAKVINHGTITVRDAGVAAFVAPQVANDGIITAHMGRIAFGGAQAFTLDLHGDNLIRFQVGDAVTKLDDKGALVGVDGVVDARGGSVLITASAARDLVNQSVRIGTPQAASMQTGPDGKVSLVAAKVAITAPGEVQVGRNVAMDLSSATNAAPAGSAKGKGGKASDTENAIGWVGSLNGDGSAPGQAMAASGSGGTLTISAARTILDGTINLDGSKAGGTAHITGSEFLSFGSILSASGQDAGGKIRLDAGGFSLAGRITVNAALGKGGSVDIRTTRRAIDTGDAFIDASGLHGGAIRYVSDDQIISSGKFRASGSHGFGGNIDVSAPRLDLFSAQFYAQGGIRGGRVRLGGEFQGGKNLTADELPNALRLVATDAVTIDVSAIGMRGNAGEIVIWSDEKTTFLGNAIARGGLVGGVGGQIEISGKETLLYRGTVETARDGQRGGTLLLDPKNIIIADGASAPSQYSLVLQAFASNFPAQVVPPPGIEAGDGFGTSVSLDGNRLAVGARSDGGATNSLTDVGAVYLFSFADSAFSTPLLSAVIGSGYSGGNNISVGALEAGDFFGHAVSLSGLRLAVAARNDDGVGNAATDAGAVYLFTFANPGFGGGQLAGVLGSGYSGPASLDVPNLAAGDLFGTSLSLNGDRLAVGALFDDGATDSTNDAGAVYLFSFTNAQFATPALEAIIGQGYSGGKNVNLALDVDDYFGSAVALDGNRLAIGAVFDDGEGNVGFSHGAVYLFSFADAAFNSANLEATIGFQYSGPKDIAISGLSPSDHFGNALSLQGSRLAVLAPLDDGRQDTFTDTGAVYLFTFADDVFSGGQLVGRIGADYAELGGNNLSISGLQNGDTLTSLSLSSNRLVISVGNDDGRRDQATDSGAVYLFTFGDEQFGDGRQVGILGADYTSLFGLSLLGNGLEEQDNFGSAVALDGNRLAVGARFDDGATNSKTDSGAVYLFTFGDAQFSAPVLQSIIGSGYSGGKNISVGRLEADDLFGSAVSLDSLRLAIGAPGDDGIANTQGDAGAVYLFTFDDETFLGGRLARVLDFESLSGGTINSAGSLFGSAVSLDGTILAVGAPGDAGASGSDFDAGAVHIFDTADSGFGSTPELLTTLGLGYSAGLDISVAGLEAGDRFGTSVSLDGLRLAVGAPNDDGGLTPVTNAGAVYVYSFSTSNYGGGTLDARLGAFYSGLNDFDTGSGPLQFFGQSVALQQLQLVVGAVGNSGRNGTQNNAGAVYLFTAAPGFTDLAQVGIIGADYLGAPGDFDLKLAKGEQFGAAVAFDNGRLVVGASNNPGRNGSAPGSGAAYLFTFADTGFGNARLIDKLGAGYTGFSNLSLSQGFGNPLLAQIEPGDQFGFAVSLDGNRLAVGAPADNGAFNSGGVTGAVYLFSFADLAFGAPVLEAIIGFNYSGGKNLSLPVNGSEQFGTSVSLDGLQLAVGAPGNTGASGSGGFTGAVYLFTFADSLFSGATLRSTIGVGYTGPSDIDLSVLASDDGFGRSVALSGTRLAVGAPGDDGAGDAVSNAGAVYLFTFTDSQFNGGLFEGTIGAGYSLGPKDLDINRPDTQLEAGDVFGTSVAFDGLRLFVGAPGDQGLGNNLVDAGAVYGISFFNSFFNSPSLSLIIGSGYADTNDTDVSFIESSDMFGSSVSAAAGLLAIGALGDDGANNSVPNSGKAYLFSQSGGTYNPIGAIGRGYGGDADVALGQLQTGDRFGMALSLNQNRLLVGASGDEGATNKASALGAVYLFSFTGGEFANLSLAGIMGRGYGAPQNVSVSQVSPGDRFGSAVSLTGDLLAIGAPGDRSAAGTGADVGAVYLFTFAGANFSTPTLKGILGKGYTGGGNFDVAALEDGDRFGESVSLGGFNPDLLAVGAPGDDGDSNATTDAGAVYLFRFDSGLNNPVLEATIGSGYTGGKNRSITALGVDDGFGSAVSLRFDQLVVGAPGDDGASDTVTDAGAVYALTFSNTIDFSGQTPVFNYFEDGTLIGTLGAGYSGTNDLSIAGIEAGDLFGSSLSLDGLSLAVGALGDDGAGNALLDVGGVYLLAFDNFTFSSPSLRGTIGSGYTGGPSDFSVIALDGGNAFGAAVALLNDRLVVGAPGDSAFSGGGIDRGAAFLFSFGSSNLESPALDAVIGSGYIGSTDLPIVGLQDLARFGSSVTLEATRLIVGASGDTGNGRGDLTGALYLFSFDGQFTSNLALSGVLGGAYANGPTSSLTAQGINRTPVENIGNAISLDGQLLAIGSPFDGGRSGLLPASGAVYLISFSNAPGLDLTAPVLEGVIGPGYTGGKNLSLAILEQGDNFGASVSLTGSFLAVGAPGDDGAQNDVADGGAVYTFAFQASPFENISFFSTVGNGYAGVNDLDIALEAGDRFGSAVAISLSNLLVGAPFDDGLGNAVGDSGAVYLLLHSPFVGAGGVIGTIGSGYTGLNSLDLTALDPGDNFGASLSVDTMARQLAVGAPRDEGAGNIGGSLSAIGAVYTFTFADSQAGGVAQAGIIGRGYTGTNDGDPGSLDNGDLFGSAVSLNAGRLAIGAPGDQGAGNIFQFGAGAVYLYGFANAQLASPLQRSIIGNGYVGTLNGAQLVSVPVEQDDAFGAAVSLSGNSLAVGAPGDDGPANSQPGSGAVQFFQFSDAAFTSGRLVGAIGADYRASVGLDLAVALTPTFVQLDGSDHFGGAVSLDGVRLAIGARGDDGSINGLTDAGAVYLFTFSDFLFGGATLQSVIGHGYVGGKNLFLTQLGAEDFFGTSVSLDGNRLAVGAPRDDGATDSVVDAGAVYLFSFADAQFGGVALEAIAGSGYTGGKNVNLTDLQTADDFGISVSLDGNRLAVGAVGDDAAGNPPALNRETGAVYLLSFAGSQFEAGALEAVFGLGFDGGKDFDVALDDGDMFGISVSLDGTRLAVGAAGDDGVSNGLTEAGAVYLFTFTDLAFSGGVQRGIVGASYAGPGDVNNVSTPFGMGSGSLFGSSVALDGNQLAIGGPEIVSTLSSPSASGAVYLLTFADSSFGGGTIVEVLAKGAVNFGTNPDFDVELDAFDRFGSAVSLDSGRLVVGALGDDGFGNPGTVDDSGAVYLFTFSDLDFSGAQLRGNIGSGYTRGVGTPVAGLGLDDRFGSALSLDGNRLAIGAPGDDGGSINIQDAGAVYLFTFADADFASPVLQGIVGRGYSGGKNVGVPQIREGSGFGSAVSLDGTRLVVGAPGDAGVTAAIANAGAVYLLTFADTDFNGGGLQGQIGIGYGGGNNLSLGFDVGDRFGSAVSLLGNQLVVGAPGDDGQGNSATDSGAVYLITFTDPALLGAALVGQIGSGYSGSNDLDLTILDSGDGFGASLSLDGLRLAVGATGDDGAVNGSASAGAVHLFTFTDSAFATPTLARTLGVGYSGANAVTGLETGDLFGSAVALRGTVLAVGAPGDRGAGNEQAGVGAAYVFAVPGATFGDDPSLTSRIGRGYNDPFDINFGETGVADLFASALTLDGGRLVVGVPGDDGPEDQVGNAGSVYFFALGSGGLPGLGFGDNPGADVTINASALAAILSGGTGVTLQANNDITVNSAILVNNPSGDGGALTLQAGRSILINAGITTDGGNFTAHANDPSAVIANRDTGFADITFGSGGFVDAGAGTVDIRIFTGVNPVTYPRGTITLGNITGSLISVANGISGTADDGAVVVSSGAVLAASGAGDAITISGSVFTNNAGSGAFNLTGGGRFRVFSNDYDAITRGGLIGNNLYNRTIADSITQPGNLFIFSRQPILTFTADDATRTYGQGSPGYTFQVSGLVNGDSESYAYSGLPNLFDTASGNAGVDSILIEAGSLFSDVGYGFDFVGGTLSTLKALLTITADNASREYGLDNPQFTASYSGFVNGDDEAAVSGLDFSTSASNASDVGTYSITPFGASAANYDFSYVPGTLTITKALLTVTADNASREYGLANPTFTGSISGFRNGDTDSVISGLTYGTVATTASNVGTYSITGSGASATNYDFSYVPGTLTITKALLTVTADNASREYGLANPTFTGTISGLRAGDTASVVSGLTYGTVATTASNVGTYAITASGGTATNYDFSYVPGTLTITRALLTVTADNASREYGLANPTFTGSISGFRNGDTASVISGLTYGTVATIASNAGTYAITGSGASATNYDFSYVPGTLTITKALLTVTADDASREYGLANPTFTGSISGFRNGDTASVISGLAYGTVATTASNVGTYSITGSGATATNYDFAYVPGTLTITKALLTVTADNASREYGLANPAFTGSISGFRNGDTASVISGLAYGSSAVLNSAVGTYAITGSGATATNYDFSYVPGTLTITKALLTVTADNVSREYGLANPTLTGTISGLRAGDTASVVSGLTYATVATTGSAVGSYAITASGGTATNYDFSYVPGTLTVTRALLTVTADNASREYGLANPGFTGTVTGFRNGDSATVVSGLTYGTVATTGSNAGTYAITGSGASATNYDFTYVPGTLTITKALLTVTADSASREYGLANPTFTGGITGFRNGDTASVVSGLTYGTSAVLNSAVGTSAITGSGATATNYDFSYVPGTLTITKALLTVTADNVSREYGLANPTLTGTISGLRAGDTASVVSGLTYATVANTGSAVGSYAITASGGTATNYDFAYAPGTLTITRALLTVTANDATREYGLANPTFTGSIAGFRNGDNATVVSGLTYGTVATIASNAGTYAITGAGASATNYDFAYVPGTLTITKALLTVTADNASREYGLANPTFTGSITGFRNGDTASVISGLAYGSSAVLNSAVGTYAITGSGASATNYDFSYIPGTLTITRALLTVTADNASREYGLANPVFTGTISGLRAGDTASVVSGLTYGTVANTGSAVGSYSITASGGTATNYDFAYAPGTLTITRALLTVTADNASREYGLANPTFTGSISGFRNGDTAAVVSGLTYGTVATIGSNVGTYAITGSGASATNYDFAYVPGTLTITKALLTVTADNASREYGLANPTFTGSITGFRNGDTASVISGLAYGSSAVLNSAVGTYAITGSGATATNYDFSYVPGTLTITKALLTVTADNGSREYGLANPTLTGTISGLRAGDTASVVNGLTYGTVATTGSAVGSYAITASGGAATNYDFSYVPGTLTITKALLTVTADNASREYGLANPTFMGSISGFRNGDTDSVISGLTYGTVATTASNVGTYAITGSGATATNYDFSYVLGTLTITTALLTVTADNASREYGLANPTFTGSITGFRNGDTASVISGLAYGTVATTASNVGTYAITGSGGTATNYDFSYVPGTLTITRALLTITANDATREYGLANPVLTGTIAGLRNGDTASVISGLVYGTSAGTGSNLGSYAITASGGSAANYDFAYVPGTLTITKALLTVTAGNAAREYGLANPALTSTISGLRNGDTASVVSGLVLATPATQASGVGSYAITASGGSALNYDFAYVPGTLVINPATLTVAIDSKTRTYGAPNPALTASITGFRNGDGDQAVSGLRLTTEANARSNVGSYVITGAGATAANYRFDYVPGTLSITKAMLQVRVNDARREYGLANPAFSASISGFRNGDNAAVVTGLTFGTPATIGSDVGLYAITASGGSALNYDFTYIPGRLTISQAQLLITADSKTMTQGSGDPVLTVSYSGLRNGDTGSVVTGLVLRTSGGANAAPGQYIINASRGSARNYQITYRPGVMTVLPAVTPPAQDPPGTGGSQTPPAGTNPPVTTTLPPTTLPIAGGNANPPASPAPPASGTAAPGPVAPAGSAGTGTTSPVATSVPEQTPGPVASASPAAPSPVIAMPPQGTVSLPVSPDGPSPMQVLQGLSAPLPVLVSPELRPADDGAGNGAPQGDGQRGGCEYISLCNGTAAPLWTWQLAQ
jgi:filamentous hemagglutinin family protein